MVYSQEDNSSENSLLEQLDISDLDTVLRTKNIGINTASRSFKNIEELPFTTYIITKEEILENNYNTLTDVLRDVPGIKVSQPGDSKTGETFTINGLMGNYYTKILLNGIPITPSGAPGMPIGGQLPIKQAERIEIISNPSSAIYGADAMGGVINIITDQNHKRSTYGNAIFSIGDFGYNEVNLLLGGKIGKDQNILKYNFFANHSEYDDLNTKNNYDNLYNLNNYSHIDTTGLSSNGLYEGTAEKPFLGNLPSSNLMYGVGVEYKSFKFSMFHLSRKSHNAIGNLPYYTSYQLPDTYWGEEINRYSLTYNIGSNNLHSHTEISYLNYNMKNGSSELRINSPLNNQLGLNFSYGASDDVIIDQLFNYKAGTNTNLAFGANFTYSGNLPIYQNLNRPYTLGAYTPFSSRLESNKFNYYILDQEELINLKEVYGDDYVDFSPFNFYQYGFFGQVDYTINKLNVLIDLRFDNNSIYGGIVSSRTSVLYKVTSNLNITSSYSRSFKTPSSYYKYSSYALPNDQLEYIPFPNSNLEYEKLDFFEFGIKYSPTKQYSFEVLSNYYVRKNEIIFSFTNPDLNSNLFDKYSYYGYVNNKNNGSNNFLLQGNIKMKDIVKSLKLGINLSATYQNRTETTKPDLLRYDTYRMQPDFLFQMLIKLNLYKKLQLITSIYGNSNYDNNYYESYSELSNEDLVHNKQDNSALWANINLNYSTNNSFRFYLKINNVFNSDYFGIQTADPLKGLYSNPQSGRMLEIGVSFKMF